MTYMTKGFQIRPYLSKKWILQNMTLIKFWAITVNITLASTILSIQCKMQTEQGMSLNRISEMEDWKIISVLWQRIIRKILFSSFISVQIAPEAIYFIFEILILWKKTLYKPIIYIDPSMRRLQIWALKIFWHKNLPPPPTTSIRRKKGKKSLHVIMKDCNC